MDEHNQELPSEESQSLSADAVPEPRPDFFRASEQEIVALISKIDRHLITDLVKRNKPLQQHVFSGFRPQSLPWPQMPSRLARYVQDDSHKLGKLIALWAKSNQPLLEEVRAISVDQIEAGVVELLMRHGLDQKFQILWALRIDDRDQVRQILESGLSADLVAPSSPLLDQVRHRETFAALEMAQKKIADLALP